MHLVAAKFMQSLTVPTAIKKYFENFFNALVGWKELITGTLPLFKISRAFKSQFMSFKLLYIS